MPTILEENRRPVKKEKRSLLPELRELSKHMEELESDMTAFWKMNPALLMLIRNNKISRINPAWEAQLGYAQEYVLNKTVYDLIHEKDRSKIIDVINKLESRGDQQSTVIRFKHSEKDEWILVKMSLSCDSGTDSVFCTGWPLLSKCNDCPFIL